MPTFLTELFPNAESMQTFENVKQFRSKITDDKTYQIYPLQKLDVLIDTIKAGNSHKRTIRYLVDYRKQLWLAEGEHPRKLSLAILI